MLLRVVRGVLVALLLVVNGVVLFVAVQDRSFTAFALATVVGPIANGVLAVVSLLFTPWVRRLTGESPRKHALISVLVPAAAIVADFLVISSMDLHGC